ncbi:hypothetical protein ACFV16_07330 [Streptomyces massasporeus]|uniref:hypothetical protein n=1 Tax=Streptomyces massasporeus TaxID=67324 RepID=UPI003696C789
MPQRTDTAPGKMNPCVMRRVDEFHALSIAVDPVQLHIEALAWSSVCELDGESLTATHNSTHATDDASGRKRFHLFHGVQLELPWLTVTHASEPPDYSVHFSPRVAASHWIKPLWAHLRCACNVRYARMFDEL